MLEIPSICLRPQGYRECVWWEILNANKAVHTKHLRGFGFESFYVTAFQRSSGCSFCWSDCCVTAIPWFLSTSMAIGILCIGPGCLWGRRQWFIEQVLWLGQVLSNRNSCFGNSRQSLCIAFSTWASGLTFWTDWWGLEITSLGALKVIFVNSLKAVR